MTPSMLAKLEQLEARYEEVQALLSDPGIINDQDQFRALSKEYAQLEPVAKAFATYRQAQDNLASAQEMARDSDPELRALAEDEISVQEQQLEQLERELKMHMISSDQHDESNLFLEIRAGTGG
ncbi:MAG: PCRF domain-containing protein, partial [Candidatus Competibacteraceae bacterium]|nr:PCRF domain-containing protein [Candidatus Competibacteraceae bacterium]